jgi:hypothetical protein
MRSLFEQLLRFVRVTEYAILAASRIYNWNNEACTMFSFYSGTRTKLILPLQVSFASDHPPT